MLSLVRLLGSILYLLRFVPNEDTLGVGVLQKVCAVVSGRQANGYQKSYGQKRKRHT